MTNDINNGLGQCNTKAITNYPEYRDFEKSKDFQVFGDARKILNRVNDGSSNTDKLVTKEEFNQISNDISCGCNNPKEVGVLNNSSLIACSDGSRYSIAENIGSKSLYYAPGENSTVKGSIFIKTANFENPNNSKIIITSFKNGLIQTDSTQ